MPLDTDEPKVADAIAMPAVEDDSEVADAMPADEVESEITVAETIDLDRDFVNVVDQMASAFVLDVALMEEREAEAIVNALAEAEPAFEPMEVSEDLYPGLAYALNLEAEGLDLPAPESPEPPADAGPRRPTGSSTPSG